MAAVVAAVAVVNEFGADLATLIWIVEAAKEARRKITLVCTNSTPSTEKLENEYPPGDYGYTLDVMPKNASEKRVRIS